MPQPWQGAAQPRPTAGIRGPPWMQVYGDCARGGDWGEGGAGRGDYNDVNDDDIRIATNASNSPGVVWGGECRRRGRTGAAFKVKQNNPVEPFWPTHPFCYYYEGTTTGVSFPVLDERTRRDELRVASEEEASR